MNFFKKVFFGTAKQQQKTTQPQKTNNQQQDQIPLQVIAQLFQKSAKYIGQTTKTIFDQNKLIIYGLYKQATIGDCNTPKPSMLDFVGKSKWNAWNSNSGMTKLQAMKSYISKTVEIDPTIQKKIQSFLQQGKQVQNIEKPTQKSSSVQSSVGLKMVQQKDYSQTYSHPYFRLIDKNLAIQKQILTHELLLQKNNNPKCYPLHFAIDKQRVNIVKQFLQILTIEQINDMKDQDGTGIEQYAQIIENQEIIQLVKQKLKTKQ